jgi:hypothetical protein
MEKNRTPLWNKPAHLSALHLFFLAPDFRPDWHAFWYSKADEIDRGSRKQEITWLKEARNHDENYLVCG